MTPPAGSFAFLITALQGVLQEVVDAAGGDWHVERWGSETAHAPPCAWMTFEEPALVTDDRDQCTVIDRVSVTLTFSTQQRATVGDDFTALESIVDVAIPLIDRAMLDRTRLGVRTARRVGFNIHPEKRDDIWTTVLDVPLAIDWPHAIPPAE